ncbi:MAG TPA: hypothetical protein VNC78_01275, partial [Actinomycetota bacterium]|nr:hypothetical protein [Actinomycetota bacterium]
MTRFRIILSGVIAMALLLPLPSLITAQVAPSGSWGPPPDALLQEMEGLNDDLRRLIDDWKKGKIGGNFAGPDSEHRAFIKRVKEIEARKLAIVEQYFDGPTYGSITWSRVFTKLDCVDSRMYLALGYDLTA